MQWAFTIGFGCFWKKKIFTVFFQCKKMKSYIREWIVSQTVNNHVHGIKKVMCDKVLFMLPLIV